MIPATLLTAARSRLPATGLWRNRDFLNLWAAHGGSAIGSRITRTALPVIAILYLEASPSEVAILSALTVAPGVAVGLAAGCQVDRSAKRPIMIAADLARAICLLTLPFAAVFGLLTFAQLLIVAALVGALTTLFDLADRSYLPALVGKDDLLEANAKLETTNGIAEAIGPGLSGLLMQILTAPAAILVDAGSFVWSAARLSRIQTPEPRPAAPALNESMLESVQLGFAACLTHRVFRPVLLAEAARQFFNGVFFSLYMVITLGALKLSPLTVGLIISAGGIGALAGACLVAPMRAALGPVRALTVSFFVAQAAVMLVPAALIDGSAAIPLLLSQQLLGDAFLTAYLIYSISLRQQVLPSGMLVRANAAFHIVSGVMVLAGALATIVLARWFDPAALVWIAAIGGLIAGAPLIPPYMRGAGAAHD